MTVQFAGAMAPSQSLAVSDRLEAEVAAYVARVEAELESQKELVDSEANEERLAAPDVRRIPVSRPQEVQ